VSEGSGYKTVSNGALFVISGTGGIFQNINASAWNVTSCRPVQVYTAAASLNPTYTYIFAHKIFHFKELGAETRKILKYYFKGWMVQAAANMALAQCCINGRKMYPAKQVTSVSRWAVFHEREQNFLKCTARPYIVKWTDKPCSTVSLLVVMLRALQSISRT
jgi:hypothetical protein